MQHDYWAKRLNVGLVLLLAFAPVVFAIYGIDVVTIGVVSASIAVALCFVNLDKLVRFKTSFIEIELQKAVDKAQAAITDLKNLALRLTGPVVSMYTQMGAGITIGGTTLDRKLQDVDAIKELLRQFGATDNEIEEACRAMHDRAVDQHLIYILDLINLDNLTNGSFKAWFDPLAEQRWPPVLSVQEIRDAISRYNLDVSPNAEERIRDYESYLATGRLRRPEKFNKL